MSDTGGTATINTASATVAPAISAGLWEEAWRRYKQRKLPMLALCYIGFLSLVALFAPAIAGTKPVVCRYQGKIYFPALGYLNPRWENGIFTRDGFRKEYGTKLKERDPDSWAVWPLFFQDPYRRVRASDWPGGVDNPSMDQGNPNRHNFFGTTQAGVDVFASMVHGTRIALLVGFLSTGIAAVIGITLGSLAGFFRGWVDIVISRLIEVVLCVPSLVLILALLALLPRPTIWHMMAVLGFTGWTTLARLTRGEFFKLRESEFVTSARALGASDLRIIFRHILPNSLAPLLVPITFGIASAILTESALSFLGFGAPPPNPSWGTMLQKGSENHSLWWLILFPGMAVFSVVLAYNIIGDAIQEVTDPRLREAGR